MECERNPKGGLVVPEEDAGKAKAAYLITLPIDVVGKNCGNCTYYNPGGYCDHPSLRGIAVNNRMACKHWENLGILESWNR